MPTRPIAVPTQDELAACLRTLEALSMLSARELGEVPAVHRVLAAAYSLSRRAGSKLRDPAWQRPRREEDRAALAATGLRAAHARKNPDGSVAPALDAPSEPPSPAAGATLSHPHRCYVCRTFYSALDPYYDRLCPPCARLHHRKRAQSAPLDGRVALVTGGRVRIGYATSLKLLRCGADVIATTRYPAQALLRYAREPDYPSWGARLRLHALDLRDLPALVRFADRLASELPRLDLLINNAAHTVDHPAAWHESMAQREAHARAALPPDRSPARPAPTTELAPAPRDERPRNSWRQRIGEIAPTELLTSHAVNALAPFLLVDRLRALLARDNPDARFVINVSASEGRFYQREKTAFHPHTNMAKAALNMLTRTVGDDLAAERVYALSVDPGWVSSQTTDAARAAETLRGFAPPLGEEDAAARILDPVFTVLSGAAEPRWGVLLRHFEPVPW